MKSHFIKIIVIIIFSLILILLGYFLFNNKAEEHAVTISDIEREYNMYVPNKIKENSTGQYPLVIMLHGGGIPPEAAVSQTKFNELADKENFIVAYPIGKSPNQKRSHSCWNTSYEHCPQNADDIGFIRTLLSTITENYPVNSDRIYVAGFSIGALFAQTDLYCELGDQVAAIASVDGGIIYENCPDRTVRPLLFFQNPDRGSVNHDLFAEEGRCDDEPHIVEYVSGDKPTTRISYANCQNNSDIVAYTITDVPHEWFHLARGPEQTIESASTIMWDFFKQYSLKDIHN